MAFRDVEDGLDMIADDCQQLVACLNGYSGRGQPIRLTELNNPGEYALRVRNLDASAGLHLLVLSADGSVELLKITKDGVRLSVDGVTGGLSPATTNGIETLSNKTLILGGRLQRKFGTDVAAVAGTTLTVKNDGDIYKVTVPANNATIQTLALEEGAPQAGAELRLLFSNYGNLVQGGGNIVTDGIFISNTNAVLELLFDGTNWIETRRRRDLAVGCHLKLYQATVSVSASDLDSYTAVRWGSPVSGETWVYGTNGAGTPIWDSNQPTRLTPGIGKWSLPGAIGWENSGTGFRRVALRKNGSTLLKVGAAFKAADNASGRNMVTPFNFTFELTSASDYVEVVCSTTDATSIKQGSSGGVETSCELRRVGA